MQVRLEVTHKTGKKKTVYISSDAVIGRGRECSLRIASNEISRQHCKLTVIDSGVFVRDLESSNGTYVDDKLIPPNQDVALIPGSRLSVGPVQFIVHFEASSSTIEQPGSTVEFPAMNISPDTADHGKVTESDHGTRSSNRDEESSTFDSNVADPAAADPASEIETIVVDPEVVQAAFDESTASATDEQVDATELAEETASESPPSPRKGKLAALFGGLSIFGRKGEGKQPEKESQPATAMQNTETGASEKVDETVAEKISPSEPTDGGSGLEGIDSETTDDKHDAPDGFDTEADKGDEEHGGAEDDEREKLDNGLGDFLSQFD